MSGKTTNLGVDWTLPGKKRRFATSTTATSDLVCVLAEDGRTWREMVATINYDEEARAIARRFVEAGYGDVPARNHVTSRAVNPADQRVGFTPAELAEVCAGRRPEPGADPQRRTIHLTLTDLVAVAGIDALVSAFGGQILAGAPKTRQERAA